MTCGHDIPLSCGKMFIHDDPLTRLCPVVVLNGEKGYYTLVMKYKCVLI